MVTAAAFVAEDREARGAVDGRTAGCRTCRATCSATTTPSRTPTGRRTWPELIPDPTVEEVRAQLGAPGMIVGDPDDALKACQEWADAGADQLCFGQGMATQEEALETIRLIGEHVIPKLDKDPEHRTSRFRREAGATT